MIKRLSQKLFPGRCACEHARRGRKNSASDLTISSPEWEALQARWDKEFVERRLQSILRTGPIHLRDLDDPSMTDTETSNHSVLQWLSGTGKDRKYALSPELERCMEFVRKAQESPVIRLLDDLPEMALLGNFRVHPAGQQTSYLVYHPKRLIALLPIYVPVNLMCSAHKERV